MSDTAPDPTPLRELVRERRVLVCLGPGGVGKTTTAAALGVGAALLGRRTLVLTIDPARRLAVAMGMDSVSGEVRQAPASWWADGHAPRADGPGPHLSMMMLDTKRACDHIVDKHARDEDIRRAIKENPLYEQFSTALAGSHDYLAMERVYELRQDDEFDLIVLDTPPAAQAVEFLEAPGRLMAGMDTAGLDHLLRPLAAAGRTLVGGRLAASRAALGTAGRVVAAGLSRFTGGELLTDLARFLVSFSSMFSGFQARAAAVMELLGSDETAFLIVSAPTDFAASEALRLRRTLGDRGLPFGGYVVNRFHPPPEGPPPPADEEFETLIGHLEQAQGPDHPLLNALTTQDLRRVVQQLGQAWELEATIAARDGRALGRLRASAERRAAAFALVPELPEDVHDLRSLTSVARHLGVIAVDGNDPGSTY